jgi:hypothetical protein
MITVKDIHDAINKWPSVYQTEDGELVVGDACSRISAALRDNRWKRVPRLDSYDLKQLGCQVVKAQYVNGARPTGKFIDVVVVRPYTGPTPMSLQPKG